MSGDVVLSAIRQKSVGCAGRGSNRGPAAALAPGQSSAAPREGEWWTSMAQFALRFVETKTELICGQSKGDTGVSAWWPVCAVWTCVRSLTRRSWARCCLAAQACHRVPRVALKFGAVAVYARPSLVSPKLSLCCIEERTRRRGVGTLELCNCALCWNAVKIAAES